MVGIVRASDCVEIQSLDEGGVALHGWGRYDTRPVVWRVLVSVDAPHHDGSAIVHELSRSFVDPVLPKTEHVSLDVHLSFLTAIPTLGTQELDHRHVRRRRLCRPQTDLVP